MHLELPICTYLSSLARVGKQVEFENLTTYLQSWSFFPKHQAIFCHGKYWSVQKWSGFCNSGVTKSKSQLSIKLFETTFYFILFKFATLYEPNFLQSRGCFPKFANDKWLHFKTTSSHFIGNYMNIFYKSYLVQKLWQKWNKWKNAKNA